MLAITHAQNKSAARRKRRSVEPWLSGFCSSVFCIVDVDNLSGRSVTTRVLFSSSIRKSLGTYGILFNASWSNTAIGAVGSLESSSSDWTLEFIVGINFDFCVVFFNVFTYLVGCSCSFSYVRRPVYFSVDVEIDTSDV